MTTKKEILERIYNLTRLQKEEYNKYRQMNIEKLKRLLTLSQKLQFSVQDQ